MKQVYNGDDGLPGMDRGMDRGFLLVLICVDGYFHNGYAFGTYQIKQSAAVVVPQEAVSSGKRLGGRPARECCKAAHVS